MEKTKQQAKCIEKQALHRVSDNLETAKPVTIFSPPEISIADAEQASFAEPLQITKLQAARRIASILKRSGVDYQGSKRIIAEARRIAQLEPAQKQNKQPELLTNAELEGFFKAVDASGNLQHQLMYRLLFTTGLRVSELTNVKRKDIDTQTLAIRVQQGKGGKDRRVLYPQSLKLALAAYMDGPAASNTYLFESRHRRQYSTRRIQQLTTLYAQQANIEKKLSPHSFRHLCLTRLTAAGLSDAQIQIISGHSTKSSLEVYQHLSLASVERDYQDAMKGAI